LNQNIHCGLPDLQNHTGSIQTKRSLAVHFISNELDYSLQGNEHCWAINSISIHDNLLQRNSSVNSLETDTSSNGYCESFQLDRFHSDSEVNCSAMAAVDE